MAKELYAGIGGGYTVSSNEFAPRYAASRGVSYMPDAGRFYPAEMISDKISFAILLTKAMLLHVRRSARRYADHVAILNDALNAIAQSSERTNLLDCTHHWA